MPRLTPRLTPQETKIVEWALDGMDSGLHASPEDIEYNDLRYRIEEQLRDMIAEDGIPAGERTRRR